MATLETIETWIRANPRYVWWMFALSAALFLLSVVMMPLIISRIRADYFIRSRTDERSWWMRHRVLRYGFLASRNLLGAFLIAAGLAMLVLPGQGILTILVGISLVDFPGKRRLELRIVRQRHVRQAINWLRKRARQPPLELPAPPPRRRRRRSPEVR